MPKRYCVQRVLKKLQEPGTIKDKRRSGRSKNLFTVDTQYLKLMSLRNKKKKFK